MASMQRPLTLILVISVFGSGCLSASTGALETAAEPETPPGVATEREELRGVTTVLLASSLNGQHRAQSVNQGGLEVRGGATRVELTLEWDAATPLQEELQVGVGNRAGAHLVRSASPATIVIEGSNVTSGRWGILAFPADDPGTAIAQRVAWNATITYS
ncbi:MAG: hypothetical protein ACLGIK_08485 [Gemmatimonadota bacterium]